MSCGGLKKNEKQRALLLHGIKRLDFRGITDAAGTTFSHSLVIMVLVVGLLRLSNQKRIIDLYNVWFFY